MQLNNSTLHHVIVDTILVKGWAPSASELSEQFGVDRQVTVLKDRNILRPSEDRDEQPHTESEDMTAK